MKRLYNFLVILLIPALALAQTDMEKSPLQPDKGPIIDNISANTGNATKSDAETKQNVLTTGSEGTHSERGLQSGGAQADNANSQQVVNDNAAWKTEELSPIERIKHDLRFYPNPAISELNVELGETYEVRVSLLNVLGQEIFSKEGEMDRVKISLSDFPRGAYFLTIQYQGQVVVKRIEVTN